MAEKSIVVDQVSTGGDTLIVNSIPRLRRHLLLNHDQIAGQIRQRVLIITLRHIQTTPQKLSISAGLLGRCLTSGHPLCEQRDRLLLLVATHIIVELSAYQLNHLVGQRSIQQTPEIVPAAILRHQR